MINNYFTKCLGKPFIISGPCSAETEVQLVQTARQIAKNVEIDVLRAGIWKPRTRPDSFEGVGEVGLEWLVNAGKEIAKPTTTEVANGKHVEACLKAGIDILWLGARTSANPFAVQEIADALQGVSIPVLVKNPINPDLDLWIGAFERLEKAGITNVGAIHRGFSVYKPTKYRNIPSWEIPIALTERIPGIFLLNDPSHIAGKRELVYEIAQKAMDLNFDGLMIESHCNPNEAWSDKEQQLSPQMLLTLFQSLVFRSKDVSALDRDDISEIRGNIAELDDQLFDILTKRMQLCEHLGVYKKEHNITILQPEHWRNTVMNRMKKNDEYRLSEEFIRKIMDAIHQESIQHQATVMNQIGNKL